MKERRTTILLLAAGMAFALMVAVTGGALYASELCTVPERLVVGTARPLAIVPATVVPDVEGDVYLWRDTVTISGASFLKVHFEGFALETGDVVQLLAADGTVVEQVIGSGPKDLRNFWSLSVPGETATIEFRYRDRYEQRPFLIDQVIAGDLAALPNDAQAPTTVCGDADYERAVCYSDEPQRWASARASAGIMVVQGDPAAAVWCSGANVSPDDYVLTAGHCLLSQEECDNAEFVFDYRYALCSDTSTVQMEWQGYRCDEIVAYQPYIDCTANLGSLDFALASVLGNPSATYGFLTPNAGAVAPTEGVYMLHHPAGRPQVINQGTADVFTVDGPVLRYSDTLDTEPGSSGAPIMGADSNTLIGIHTCGSASAGCENSGVSMAEIYPEIRSIVCTEDVLELVTVGFEGLQQQTGNGDTTIDPGELWQFYPRLANRACVDATGVSARISLSPQSDSVVRLPVQDIYFGTVAVGETRRSELPVVFEVDTTSPCGSGVAFDLTMVMADAGPLPDVANVATMAIGRETLTDVFTDDFSEGLNAWQVEHNGSGAGPASTWTADNPGALINGFTEPFALVDSLLLGPGETMDEALISPVLHAVGLDELTLYFANNFQRHGGGLDELADVDIASVSTSGKWVNVVRFSETSVFAVPQTVDLTPWLAQDLQIRFRYHNAEYEAWWAIDDVKLRGATSVCSTQDRDGDGEPDSSDNCLLVANPDQRDSDGDGFGNLCDPDLNNDGMVNFSDLALLKALFFTTDANADFDGDGNVNFLDLALLKDRFFGAPGPGVPPGQAEIN